MFLRFLLPWVLLHFANFLLRPSTRTGKSFRDRDLLSSRLKGSFSQQYFNTRLIACGVAMIRQQSSSPHPQTRPWHTCWQIGNWPPLRQYLEIQWPRGRPKQKHWHDGRLFGRSSSWHRQFMSNFGPTYNKWKLSSWGFQIWSQIKNTSIDGWNIAILRKGFLRSFAGRGRELKRVELGSRPLNDEQSRHLAFSIL